MKTTKNTTTRTITRYERLTSSVNGNPRFRFYFDDGSQADSSSDAGWCYAVGNPGMREGSTVEIEWTRAGKIRTMSADQSEICHYCGFQADGEVFHDSGDGVCARCASDGGYVSDDCNESVR